MDSDQTDGRARARLGTVLRGKYRLDSVIGTGGMAVVYKAVHRNQAEFAVKMLHPELSLNDNIRNRFLREGYAANSVKHSGVVLVVDDDVAEDGAAFLVMELLNGLTADEAWTALGGRLPLDASCAVAIELLDVLAAAHDKGILHRDVKPANVFLTRDGTLKVLDFGIARVRDSMAGNSQATGTGMLLGTPAFMAPEQVTGKPSDIDARADLWAVGATIFNLVSGQLVHEAETGPQLMVKLATQPPRSVLAVVPDAPPAVAAVVDKALSFDKTQRWASASAMQEALRAACAATYPDFLPRAVIARLVAQAKPGAPGMSPSTFSGRAAQQSSPGFGTPSPAVPPGSWGGQRVATGAMTPGAVYHSGATPTGATKPSNKGAVIGIGVGLAALAVVGAGLVVMHHSNSASVAPATAVTMPPSLPSAAPSAAPPTTAAAAVVAPLPPEHLAPSAAVPQEPVTEPPAPSASHHAAAVSHKVVPAAGQKAEPSSRESAPKPNCNPPYTLDQNGEKHFKPECFQ